MACEQCAGEGFYAGDGVYLNFCPNCGEGVSDEMKAEYSGWEEGLDDEIDKKAVFPTTEELKTVLNDIENFARLKERDIAERIAWGNYCDKESLILVRMNKIPRQLIGVKKLASILDVSPGTVERMIRAGEVPSPIWIRGSRKWNLDTIYKFIQDKESACEGRQVQNKGNVELELERLRRQIEEIQENGRRSKEEKEY